MKEIGTLHDPDAYFLGSFKVPVNLVRDDSRALKVRPNLVDLDVERLLPHDHPVTEISPDAVSLLMDRIHDLADAETEMIIVLRLGARKTAYDRRRPCDSTQYLTLVGSND